MKKLWTSLSWSEIQSKVYSKQIEIFQASLKGNLTQCLQLQQEILQMKESKLLAVRKVTQDNKSNRMSGVDGISKLTINERLQLVKHLKIDGKTDHIRKLLISQPGTTEKRLLSISTIKDRAKQALALIALEPQFEAVFCQLDSNSFGFRPGKFCADARIAVTRWIRKPRFVLLVNIRKCFDTVSHNYILHKLHCSNELHFQIKRWLEMGVLDGDYSTKNYIEIESRKAGVPQSGIIAPLLMNLTLCDLEKDIQKGLKPRTKPRYGYVRYAGDLVVFAEKLDELTIMKENLVNSLKIRGLSLSNEQMHITNSLDGFEFLGFHFKTYQCSIHHASAKNPKFEKKGFSYLCTPSKKFIKNHKKQVNEIINTNRQIKTHQKLIRDLSPVIHDWTNYFKVCNSKKTFSKMDKWLYTKLFKWSVKQCKGSRTKAFSNFYIQVDKRKWNFGYINEKKESIYIRRYDSVLIPNIIPIKRNRSPYDGDLKYWVNRVASNSFISKWTKNLLIKQKGKCVYCEYVFTVWDEPEIHHKKSRKNQGKLEVSNIVVVHNYCHKNIHREITKVTCQDG